MRLPLLIFLFVWAVSLKAQVNLVPNPSFEEHDGCPNNSGGIWRATPWTYVLGSVDYYNECGTTDWSVPLNWAGGGWARTGQAYAGLAL